MKPKRPATTKMCVRCLARKATHWTGHVLDGRRKVTAGWCTPCLDDRGQGFRGHWMPSMNEPTARTTEPRP